MKIVFFNHTEDALIEVTIETKEYPCNTDYITTVVMTTRGMMKSCELMSVKSDSVVYTCHAICICPAGMICTGLLSRISNTHDVNAKVVEVSFNVHDLKTTPSFWHKMYREQYECSMTECHKCKLLSTGICVNTDGFCSQFTTSYDEAVPITSPVEGSSPVAGLEAVEDSSNNDCVVNSIILSFFIFSTIVAIASNLLLSYYCMRYNKLDPYNQRIYPSFV